MKVRGTWGLGDRDGDFFHLGHVNLEVPVSLQVRFSRLTNIRPWHAADKSGPENFEIHRHIDISILPTKHFSKHVVNLSLVWGAGVG